MTKPWNMAGVRHRQTPRKYKPVGPVGQEQSQVGDDVVMRTPVELLLERDYLACDYLACEGCGYHVCSCPPKPWQRSQLLGHFDCIGPPKVDPAWEAFKAAARRYMPEPPETWDRLFATRAERQEAIDVFAKRAVKP